VTIPPGITVKIALRSKSTRRAHFEGQLLNAIGELVPKGAIVHGRIVRLGQEFEPSHHFTLGLKFDSVEVNGREAPLTLMAVTRHGLIGLEIEPFDPREGIGMFEFAPGRLMLDQKFVSEWKTAVREQSK